MNIFSKVMLFFSMIIVVVSCADINSWGDSAFTPSLKASFIYFPKAEVELGGTDNLSTTVQLQAVNTPWKITNPASDWLTVSPTEGSGDETITFTAKENPTSDNIRTAVLNLESVDVDYAFSRPVTVNQGKALSILTPNINNIRFSREAQSQNVTVSANTDWVANCNVSWIHLNKLSDATLTITVDDNNEEIVRAATIVLSGSKSTEIKIVQDGISATPSQTMIEFSREAQTKTIDVLANYSWTASCSASWVHLASSPESGELSISVDENNETTSRTTKIILSNCKSCVIEITQTGVSVNPNRTTIVFSRESQTKTIDVSANYNWTASCSASWVHLTSSPELGKLSICVDANNETLDRTATITLSGCSSEITVSQEGIYVTPYETSLVLSHNAQTKDIIVSSNYEWTASCSADWVRLSPSPESRKLSIFVEENKGTTDRTCNISLTKSKSTVKILQHGLSFEDLVSQLDFDTESSTQTLNVQTNGTWKATPNESWIHVSPTSGTGNAVLSVSVDKNKGAEKRIGTISVTVGDVVKYVSIQQRGAYLDVTSNMVSTIPAAGGTRSVTFSTSENWRVERTNPSWVSVNKTNGTAGNNTIVLSFMKNTQKATRRDTTYIRTDNSNIQDLRVITIQDGMFLYVTSSTSSEIPASGGTRTVSFMSSDDWTIDCGSDSWVTVDKTSGVAGSNTITLRFSENTKFTSRTNTVCIRTKNSDLKDLSITSIQRGLEINNNGHEYVDLGLPSGTLWATCNVGASTPEGYGGYYAWGEIKGTQEGKTYFDWSTYQWYNGSWSTFTKYCTTSDDGYVDNKVELDLSDDVARQKWGGGWRIPSKAQIDELIEECTSEIVSQKGVYGRKITSKKNGKSLFLPAAGYKNNGGGSSGESGYYWSRILCKENSKLAYTIFFYKDPSISNIGNYRSEGHCIRPVLSQE